MADPMAVEALVHDGPDRSGIRARLATTQRNPAQLRDAR
jgi:hypothetical protein